MTRKDVEKWNNMCSNGFMFNLREFLYRKEKEPVKQIDLAEGKMLIATIIFVRDYEEKESDYGQTFKVPNGLYKANLHLQEWKDAGKLMSSRGMGVYIPIGEPQKRRTYKYLAGLTKDLPEEVIMKLWKENKGKGKEELV